MAGRPRNFEDEELIDRAIEVFWSKGYASASAEDLMKAMKIGQGSFYRSFKGGKRELYQKSLRQFIKKSIGAFHDGLERAADPVQFIRNFFLSLADRSPEQMSNGCYLGNAIVELSNLDEDTKMLSVAELEKLKSAFEKALLAAQKKGLIGSDKSATLLSAYLINLWNGINVTQRMHADRAELRQIITMNLQVLE